MADPLRSGAIFRYKTNVPLSGQKIGTEHSVNTPGNVRSNDASKTPLINSTGSTNSQNASFSQPISATPNGPFVDPNKVLSSGKNSLLKQRFDMIYRATPLPPTVNVESFRPPTASTTNPMSMNGQINLSHAPTPSAFLPPPPPNTIMSSRHPYEEVSMGRANYSTSSYMHSSPYQQHSTSLISSHSYTPPANMAPTYSISPMHQHSPQVFHVDPQLSYQVKPRTPSNSNYANSPQHLAPRHMSQPVYYEETHQQFEANEDDYPTDEEVVQENNQEMQIDEHSDERSLSENESESSHDNHEVNI